MIALLITLASIGLYLLMGYAFLYFREKGRILEQMACETCTKEYFCASMHTDIFYDDPWVLVILSWPPMLVHRLWVHGQPPLGAKIAAKAESAVKEEIERNRMHTLVQGKGEND